MVEDQSDLPQLVMEFNRPVMASYGVSVEELSTTVQTAFYGIKATKLIEKNRLYNVVIQYHQKEPMDLERLKQTPILTSSGVQVPLQALVNIEERRMP